MTAESTPPRSFARHLPTIARVLLGLMFFVFGLMGLLHRVPPPKDAMPEGAMAFAVAMGETGYLMLLVKATEALAGALLLANRFVPLALTILAPVIVNIVAFHAFLAPAGLPVTLVLAALELYLAWAYRSAFRPMRGARVTPG